MKNKIIIMFLTLIIIIILAYISLKLKSKNVSIKNGSQTIDVNKLTDVTKTQNDNFLKENILGVWAYKGEINSTFEIKKDKIIYTDFQNKPYLYSIVNGVIKIQYDGFEDYV